MGRPPQPPNPGLLVFPWALEGLRGDLQNPEDYEMLPVGVGPTQLHPVAQVARDGWGPARPADTLIPC